MFSNITLSVAWQDRTTWLLSHDCRSLICDSRHFLSGAVCKIQQQDALVALRNKPYAVHKHLLAGGRTVAVYQHPVTFGIWRLNDDSDRTTLLVPISTIVMPLTVYAKWGS